MKLKKTRGYLINIPKGEVHRLKKRTDNCCIEAMTEPGKIYCGWLLAWIFVTFFAFNGCRYCWPEKDRG